MPRDNVTWDADVVLNFLKTWAPAKRLSCRQLTVKVTVVLIAAVKVSVDKLFEY